MLVIRTSWKEALEGRSPKDSRVAKEPLRTSDDDYTKAMQLLKEEQIATRDDLLNQIQALRLAGARKSFGQRSTTNLLNVAQRYAAQSSARLNHSGAEEAVKLNIQIEDKRHA